MSWLYDKKPQKVGQRNPDEWGFYCGYCGNTFQADLQQLDAHQFHDNNMTLEEHLQWRKDNDEHRSCKGEKDKYNKQLAIQRGCHYEKEKLTIKQVGQKLNLDEVRT